MEAKNEVVENTFDFDGKEVAYMEAVVDGRFQDAQVIRAEIRSAEKAGFDAQVANATQAAKQEATQLTQEQIEFKATVKQLEENFDVLNPESEAFDTNIADEIVELRDAYISRGRNPATALRRATELVTASYGISAKNAESAAQTAAPVGEPAVSNKPLAPAAVEKKLQAAQTQPAHMDTGTVTGEPAVDVFDMTEAEFENLSEADLKRMRGDIL